MLELTDSNAEIVQTALGYVVFVTKMMAKYLSIPLPHEMVYHGSTSYVVDRARPTKRLYFSKENKAEFNAALRLLDTSIVDLCRQACVAEDQISRYRLLPNLIKLSELVSLKRVFQPQPSSLDSDRKGRYTPALGKVTRNSRWGPRHSGGQFPTGQIMESESLSRLEIMSRPMVIHNAKVTESDALSGWSLVDYT